MTRNTLHNGEDREGSFIQKHLVEHAYHIPIPDLTRTINDRLKGKLDAKWPVNTLESTLVYTLAEQMLDTMGVEQEEERTLHLSSVKQTVYDAMVRALQTSTPSQPRYTPGVSTNLLDLMSHFMSTYPVQGTSEKEIFTNRSIALQQHIEEGADIYDAQGNRLSLFLSLRQIKETMLTTHMLEKVVADPVVLNEVGFKAKDAYMHYKPYQKLTKKEQSMLNSATEDALWETVRDLPAIQKRLATLGLDVEMANLSNKTETEYLESMRTAVFTLQKRIQAIPSSLGKPMLLPRIGIPDISIFHSESIVKQFLTLGHGKPVTYDDILAFDLDELEESIQNYLEADATVMLQVQQEQQNTLPDKISQEITNILTHVSPKDHDLLLKEVRDMHFVTPPTTIDAFRSEVTNSSNRAYTEANSLYGKLNLQLLGDDEKIRTLFYVWLNAEKKRERDAIDAYVHTYVFDEVALRPIRESLQKITEFPPESLAKRQQDAWKEFLHGHLEMSQSNYESYQQDYNYKVTQPGTTSTELEQIENLLEEYKERSNLISEVYRVVSRPYVTVDTLEGTYDSVYANIQPEVKSIIGKMGSKDDLVSHVEARVHQKVEQEVDTVLHGLKEDLVHAEDEDKESINAIFAKVMSNDFSFNNVEEVEAFITHYLKKIRQFYGKPIEKLPENISLQEGAMYHVQNSIEKVDAFVKIDHVDLAEGKVHFQDSFCTEKGHLSLRVFMIALFETAKNTNPSVRFDYVMRSGALADVSLKSVAELEKAIATKRKGEKGAPPLEAGIVPGVEITVGKKADGYTSFARIKDIDEKRGVITTDKGENITFEEFYLYATHNEPGNYAGVWNTRSQNDNETPAPLAERRDREAKGVSDKQSPLKRISPVALLSVGKAFLENFKGERKRKKEMRELIAQIQLLPPGNKVRENARQTYFGKEKDKMQGMKAELDILDNRSMRKKVHDFMKAVRPGDPNIHKNDGYVTMQGKWMPAFDARTKVKNMFIYLLERYGTPYPFEEVEEYKKDRYWLHIFAEDNNTRQKAIEGAHNYTDRFDGELEIWQLHSLFNVQSEFFGAEFASLTEKAHETGNGNESKLKEQQAKVATKTNDMVNQLVEYINDARWDGIELLFAKLSEKGLPDDQMFNLFLKMYSKMTFVKEGDEQKYRSEISRSQVQKIAKAVFPKYPYLYFFFFRNEATYSKFGSILRNEARWDWKWGEPDKKTGIPQPSDPNLFKKFALHGDYTLLEGYARFVGGARDACRYMDVLSTPRESYGMTFDPDHDSSMWQQNILLSASQRVFGFVAENYDIAGFKNAHWSKYMDELFTQMREFQNGNLNDTDKLAYLNYIRKELYVGLYSNLMTSGDSPKTIRERFKQMNDDTQKSREQQYYNSMTNKKSLRIANNFLDRYEEKLNAVGLSFEKCYQAAINDPSTHHDMTRGSSPVLSLN